jgi:hypothetical protein
MDQAEAQFNFVYAQKSDCIPAILGIMLYLVINAKTVGHIDWFGSFCCIVHSFGRYCLVHWECFKTISAIIRDLQNRCYK